MKRGRKPKHQLSGQEAPSKPKSLGLFDHVKQIQQVQNPDYFQNLSDEDKKSFNHFMILRALSMNPARLEDMALIYRFFSTIPSPQLYRLLITICPPDRRYYPWIKSKKESESNTKVCEYVRMKFESSPKEAKEYVDILNRTELGRKELFDICRGFGLPNKEVDKLLEVDDD